MPQKDNGRHGHTQIRDERERGRSTANAQRHRDRVPHTHRGACRHHTYVAACAAGTTLASHTSWGIALQCRMSCRRRACSRDRAQGRMAGSTIFARRETEATTPGMLRHLDTTGLHASFAHAVPHEANSCAQSLSSETVARPHARQQHLSTTIHGPRPEAFPAPSPNDSCRPRVLWHAATPVSYTHLTLPTIYSV